MVYSKEIYIPTKRKAGKKCQQTWMDEQGVPEQTQAQK